MPRIGIVGVSGRMGRAIADAAAIAGMTVAGGIGRDGDPAALAAASDVLIDFSTPDALDLTIAAAEAANCPLVIGTTGLRDRHHARIDRAAARIAVLQTANTSLGINLLRGLVEQAARALGPDWDVEILEMHHRHKLDAPSGTALLLGEAAHGGGGTDPAAVDPNDRLRRGPGAREAGSIHYASLRGGSVAGDHQVIFAGEGERIELGHRAENRSIFARGALAAARWLVGRPPARYTMADVLGLA